MFAKIGEAVRLNRRALLKQDTVIDNNCMALTPTPAIGDPRFLLKFMQTVDLSPFAVAMTVPSVRRGDVEGITMALPPLPEQRRIVAKLDQLSARSAAARDHLARTIKLATRAKQAILAAAFRGDLLGLGTAETVKINARCWDLPEGWRWRHFEEVATIRSNLCQPSEMPDLPHVAPDNIEAGTGRLLPYNTISEDGVKSGKHKFFAGQILYSKIRPYLRKAVIVDFDGACSADMYPVDCSPEIDIRLLHRWLISEDFAWFTAEHEGRTVLPKINQRSLNGAPIPVPPSEQQVEIVRRIEAAFARIELLTEEATRAAHLLNRLDERLLAKAFGGELVPQDPNDEPAEALLARIRQTRTTAPNPKRRRPKKTAAG
ncbi:restriction endonuclease subunit S [Cereibacter sphaeroides]|uniref:restriction endonuclease subunit S n=1 Tax=Cereibacter sphaeroides TaxID=1063 RepID=UPI00399048AA